MRSLLTIFLAVFLVLTAAFLWLRDPDIPYETLVEKYGGPPSQFVTLPSGLTAHFRAYGHVDAPVLLLVHGSNAALFTWEPWAEILSDEYRVVSVDLIGHGLTSLSPGHDYSYGAYELFLEEFVSTLGISNYTLAGNSMGGGIAWRYALDHPEEVSTLVLVAASGIPSPPDPEVEESEPLVYKIARIPVLNQLLLHILPRSQVEASLLDAVAKDEIVTEEMVTLYHDLLLREGRRKATLERSLATYEPSPVERLGEIDTPTLILWGAEDKWVPVYGAHVFDEKIPNSTLIVYEDVGHIPMEEIAEESAADLRAFLAQEFMP